MAKAAILAIGSEITQGDLIDSNSAWMSAQLYQAGVQVVYHLSVADNESEIKHLLEFLDTKVDMIFTCGGLGPTVDDLSRQAISNWLNSELKFDEPSWTRVEEKLNSRKVPIRERHKSQAWFPAAAEIMQNAVGTADGFTVSKGSTRIWVLPGPPRELRAMWSDHINIELSNVQTDPMLTQRWNVFAAAESEIAELTEPLAGDLTIGFRASFPVVEVKLWYLKSKAEAAKTVISKIDKALEPFELVAGNIDQHLEDLMMNISSLSVKDSYTHGLFISRLGNLVQNLGIYGKQFRLQTNGEIKDSGLHVEILAKTDSQFDLLISQEGNQEKLTLDIPESYMQSTSRKLQFVSEYCLIKIASWLTQKRDSHP